ncbi:MAG: CoA activase, partial [Clostridium sp.]
ENICFAVIDSVVSKVSSLCGKHGDSGNYYLTGGLSRCPYVLEMLSNKLRAKVKTNELAHHAGAMGAALLAKGLKK